MYLRGEGGWCPPFPLLLFSWETHFYLPLQISTPIYALLILSSPHLHDLYFPYLYFVYKVTMLGMTCTTDYLHMHTLLFWLIIIESFILTLVQHNNYNMFILLQKKEKTSPPLLKNLWREVLLLVALYHLFSTVLNRGKRV